MTNILCPHSVAIKERTQFSVVTKRLIFNIILQLSQPKHCNCEQKSCLKIFVSSTFYTLMINAQTIFHGEKKYTEIMYVILHTTTQTSNNCRTSLHGIPQAVTEDARITPTTLQGSATIPKLPSTQERLCTGCA